MVFNAALSGIQAASTDLNVIGNNVANAGTAGFKESSAQFSDVYAASALGTGSNAVGSGVKLSSVRQSFSQGTISFSNSNMDLAINGQGFFALDDGGTRVYSRAGGFGVDREGFIVNGSSQKLVGLLADDSGNITGAQGQLQIDSANIPPTSTTLVNVGLNLSANSAEPAAAWAGGANPAPNTFNNVTSTTVFDSIGNSHVLSLYFIKTSTVNEWEVRAQVDNTDVGGASTLTFNTNGSFASSTPDPISLSYSPAGADPIAFDLDLTESTQFGSDFAVQSILQDGSATGRLDTIDVGSSGIIFGRYTNGQSRPMGQVQLANFTNVNGLQPLGDSSWGETFNSGPPLISTPGTASLGVIQSASLEDSNVDLTSELVELITAQRNFQANAQTIRTADTVTQTIINLR